MKRIVLTTILGLQSTAIGAGIEIANSTKEFSEGQGRHGWFYGYSRATQNYDPQSDFVQLPLFGDPPQSGGSELGWYLSPTSWITIYGSTVHPNLTGLAGGDPVERWAIRRWKSDFSGSVTISGDIRRISSVGDGTDCQILVDGAQVYSVMVSPGESLTYSVSVNIGEGSKIDFLTKPRTNQDADNTRFTVRVVADGLEYSPLPEFHHDPNRGLQAIDHFTRSPAGQCSFTFSTGDIGSNCIVAWTRNLLDWFSLFTFTTTSEGTEVVDVASDPSRFYRTTRVPSGIAVAESFVYPIGVGNVAEQINPERNTLYQVLTPPPSPQREATAPVISTWYNIQDVGAYFDLQGGLHPGEDWNKGPASNSDVGEVVKAVANGQVVDIRPAHSNGAAYSGFAVVLRHWLENGDTVDSIYLHVAPDKLMGGNNTSGGFGTEADFSFQEGASVGKGDVIAAIGSVTSPNLTPHLHFEMRSTITDPSAKWPRSTGNAYYGPVSGSAGKRFSGMISEEVKAAFGLMRLDGIIDASDFIDDHP